MTLTQQLKVSIILVSMASLASTQDCVVLPYSQPADDVHVYVYHGQVTLKMTWSENYKNPEDAAYKELYNSIYTELFQIYSCQLDETKDIFFGLTNITFSEGSVKVGWDLVLDQSFPDEELLSNKAAEELSKTTAFKDTIIDTQILDQMTLAFTTIGAITGVISLLSMLYGVLKKMKKLVVKAKNGEGLSTLASGLVSDKIPTKTEAPSPETSQEADVAPQGYVMPQTYIIQDNLQYTTPVASSMQYKSEVMTVQG